MEPRRYSYCLTPIALVPAFLFAFTARLAGLRAVAALCAGRLRTSNIATLSNALRRRSSLAFVRAMVESLLPVDAAGDEQLVALDSMAIALRNTRRHRCKRINRKVVGGGVLWSLAIRKHYRHRTPIRILKVIRGAWHDSRVVRSVGLRAQRPVYLMDRGFYALDLLGHWLDTRVRFIVRAKKNQLVYRILRRLSPSRAPSALGVSVDAIVRLGGPRAKVRPVVRLIEATLPSGEDLVLVTDRMTWTAQAVLEAYAQRWHIERFHRFVKSAVGLAHLYSFDQVGIEFLLYTALLLVLLLLLRHPVHEGTTIDLLYAALRTLRQQSGLGTPWRRNLRVPKRPRNRYRKTVKR